MANEVTRYTPAAPPATPSSYPRASVPVISGSGPVASFFERQQAKRDAKVLGALSVRNRAGADFLDSQGELVESQKKLNEKRFLLAEQPEKLANDLAVRRLERLDRLQTTQHIVRMNSMRRETETLQTQAVVEDARHYLKAVKEYGYKVHALAMEKRLHDIVDLELDKTHKKKLIEEIRKTKTPSDDATPVDNKELSSLLLGYRAELEATGRDSRVVEKALAELQGK